MTTIQNLAVNEKMNLEFGVKKYMKLFPLFQIPPNASKDNSN